MSADASVRLDKPGYNLILCSPVKQSDGSLSAIQAFILQAACDVFQQSKLEKRHDNAL
jgi:hypothetical protein